MDELSGSNIVYVGDINLNILKHIVIADTYLSMLASKGTLCLVNEPTHIVGTSSTCLNHVFVRFSKHKSMVTDFKAKVFYYNITDHSTLTFSIKFCSAINFDKEKWFIKTKYEQMATNSSNETWADV